MDLIRKRIAAHCFGPLGKDLALKAAFSSNEKKILLWLGQTNEWIGILASGDVFPEGHYQDISRSLDKLKIEGYYLSEEEFHELRLLLRTLDAATRFFHLHKETRPLLFDLIKEIGPQRTLILEIEKIISEEGKMRNNASQELNRITSMIAQYERELHKRALALYRKAKSEGWTADTDISVREGRLVIPILSEHKRKVKGIVHDESGSGQILYIEPAEIIELNNELRELQLEKRREVERILRTLTAIIAPHELELRGFNAILGVLDFIRAKALFALDLNARIPEINREGLIRWNKAFHPILFIHHRQQKLPTVPLNLQLNEEKRILIISGPNAGGKSVALKTTGLLQYMTQCGFPIPVGEGSTTRVFKSVFIDIGDDQSLDNDLSTYSSHLTNMRHFLKFADKHTLILIDEFGTGTDPQFGGPMAESILEELNRNKVYGVVTTHYSNLKLLANKEEGLVNGAMAYDTEKLQPLYHLETGKPGSSFAFEVAAKIGLPKSVIHHAKRKVGAKQQNVDDLLVVLERERQEAREMEEKARLSEAHFERLKEEYLKLKSGLEEKKAKLLQQAREEALRIVESGNKLIEKTVRELRESEKKLREVKAKGTEKEVEVTDSAPSKAKKALEQAKKELKQKMVSKGSSEVSGELPVIGDSVRIQGQDSVGVLLEHKGKKAVVDFGGMRTSVDYARLEKMSRKEARAIKRRVGGLDFEKEAIHFSMELDVRGKRGLEAVQECVAFVDKAIMLGYPKLRIIHGRGDGILRKLIRKELKSIPGVLRLDDDHPEAGGDGVTLVEL